MLENLYQQGGHFCLDSSSSRLKKKEGRILNDDFCSINIYVRSLNILSIAIVFLFAARILTWYNDIDTIRHIHKVEVRKK